MGQLTLRAPRPSPRAAWQGAASPGIGAGPGRQHRLAAPMETAVRLCRRARKPESRMPSGQAPPSLGPSPARPVGPLEGVQPNAPPMEMALAAAQPATPALGSRAGCRVAGVPRAPLHSGPSPASTGDPRLSGGSTYCAPAWSGARPGPPAPSSGSAGRAGAEPGGGGAGAVLRLGRGRAGGERSRGGRDPRGGDLGAEPAGTDGGRAAGPRPRCPGRPPRGPCSCPAHRAGVPAPETGRAQARGGPALVWFLSVGVAPAPSLPR